MTNSFAAAPGAVFIDADTLASRLGDTDAPTVVFVGDAGHAAQAHIAGARRLTYADITRDAPPVHGLMPDPEAMMQRLAAAGVDPRQPIVAYDIGQRGQAARLVFTLDALGVPGAQILDGGLAAWMAAGHPVASGTPSAPAVDVQLPAANYNHTVLDGTAINVVREAASARLLDTRSANEFNGSDRRAARAGHIPGARHLEWTELMTNDGRLRPETELRERLAAVDAKPEHHVIVYCHSHHRSAHTYAVLRHLGYPQVSGYPGAWSEWGNRHDLPIE